MVLEFDERIFTSTSFIYPHEMCDEMLLRGQRRFEISLHSLPRAIITSRVCNLYVSPITLVTALPMSLLSYYRAIYPDTDDVT